MTRELFKEINQWQNKTFPAATALSKAKHLRKEIDELIVELESQSHDKGTEYADCFILLFGSAFSDGMSYDQILFIIEEKFSIIKQRKWGEPDADGVVQHIKE